jgi:hypothetical protein
MNRKFVKTQTRFNGQFHQFVKLASRGLVETGSGPITLSYSKKSEEKDGEKMLTVWVRIAVCHSIP